MYVGHRSKKNRAEVSVSTNHTWPASTMHILRWIIMSVLKLIYYVLKTIAYFGKPSAKLLSAFNESMFIC